MTGGGVGSSARFYEECKAIRRHGKRLGESRTDGVYRRRLPDWQGGGENRSIKMRRSGRRLQYRVVSRLNPNPGKGQTARAGVALDGRGELQDDGMVICLPDST